VSDSSGEAFYLRDEERGHCWSPTPLPNRGAQPYVCRHGFGYSVFEHEERGIRSELWVYVAMDAPVKFSVLKVRNQCGRPRRLSATGYVEWVLGDLRPKSAQHVATEVDPGSGALFARNPYNTGFAGRVVFFDAGDAARTVSGDRTEFIGRNGSLRSPAAMGRSRLSGKVGAALDPCAAIQIPFELADGQEREIIFVLGVGRNADDARDLTLRFRESAAARRALEEVWRYWNGALGAVQVETPDPALNFLANGWLLYQTLACRLWARNATYQPGGAFGFRDQLQDGMALVHAEPRLLREHLLRCAARQFPEGDVQHWWHPPSGRGVRTHCSDDYLWLPLAISRYVLSTGDTGVLDEPIHFIEGRPVNPEEDSYYDLPNRSDETAGLYEHGRRAVLRGLRFGKHGLPLMGSGDWNDGMNRVGHGGKGESVWLAFFLYDVLTNFAALAARRGDEPLVTLCTEQAGLLKHHIEAEAWDGQWYKRAFFDNGTSLGAAENPECRIDSLPQSWAVLSGAAIPERGLQAMQSVSKHLVDRNLALIKLFDPPFDTAPWDPGYIKGYIPGVRENGGQYTHAAVWTAMAWAALQRPDEAWDCFTLLNPIRHAATPEQAAIYKVEPYVVAADVYTAKGQEGRGGWTWYTGAAGWMYQLLVEQLLGLKLKVDRLILAPLFPAGWSEYKIHYRYRNTFYHIQVVRTEPKAVAVRRVVVDNVEQPDLTISLIDDRLEHFVQVEVRD
jgi:cellobiose phosphorylase